MRMAEDDHAGRQAITKELGVQIQLVEDDNFVTNPEIFAQDVKAGIAIAILIKLNQIAGVGWVGLSSVRCAERFAGPPRSSAQRGIASVQARSRSLDRANEPKDGGIREFVC